MSARRGAPRLARAFGALCVLALVRAGRFGARPLPSASQLASGAQHCTAAGARARLATSAVHAKKKATKAADSSVDPAAYFKYLASGEDRTEEDQSPPSDVVDPDAAIAPKSKDNGAGNDEAVAAKPRSKSSQTAELIASEASEGYLDLSEELRWYLVQCTPGFERSIGRGLPMKAELAGYGSDITEARVPLRHTLVYQKRAKGYVAKEEPLMGGYVMVRMRMRRNLYNFVKDCESVLGFCGYDFGARNLAGGLKAGRGFIKPKPLSDAEVARIERQAGMLPSPPEAEFGVPKGAADAAREMLRAKAREAELADGAGGEGARAEEADVAAVLPPPVELELSFGVGDLVRVLKGPFRNLEGTVTAIGKADGSAVQSVTIELTLMGQKTAVEIDARALASVLE